MGNTKSPTATKNHPLANGRLGRVGTCASSAARESRHGVKPDDTWHYRIFVKANEPFSKRTHNSQDAGKKNLFPHPGGDSPRQRWRSRIRHVDAGERGLDNGKTGPDDGIFPGHWPDSDGWPPADATVVRPPDKPNCNSGSMGVVAETSARNLSKDKSDRPDARGRLARIVIHDKAEMMGQRESRLPEGQVSLRSANFAARRFSKSACLPSCDLQIPS